MSSCVLILLAYTLFIFRLGTSSLAESSIDTQRLQNPLMFLWTKISLLKLRKQEYVISWEERMLVHRLTLLQTKFSSHQRFVQEFKRFSAKRYVYAFGVFLLELMQNITDYTEIPAMIDERLGGTYTAEGVEEVITLTLICLDASSEKRPTMSYVVTKLERILDKEVSLTTVMGEGTPTVTLGSQLFTASK